MFSFYKNTFLLGLKREFTFEEWGYIELLEDSELLDDTELLEKKPLSSLIRDIGSKIDWDDITILDEIIKRLKEEDVITFAAQHLLRNELISSLEKWFFVNTKPDYEVLNKIITLIDSNITIHSYKKEENYIYVKWELLLLSNTNFTNFDYNNPHNNEFSNEEIALKIELIELRLKLTIADWWTKELKRQLNEANNTIKELNEKVLETNIQIKKIETDILNSKTQEQKDIRNIKRTLNAKIKQAEIKTTEAITNINKLENQLNEENVKQQVFWEAQIYNSKIFSTKEIKTYQKILWFKDEQVNWIFTLEMFDKLKEAQINANLKADWIIWIETIEMFDDLNKIKQALKKAEKINKKNEV